MPRFPGYAAMLVLSGLIVFVGSSGCTYVGPLEINTYWSPGVVKSDIGPTYEWSPRLLDAIGAAPPDTARVSERVKVVLAEQLGARGYSQATDQQPDLWINFGVGAMKMGPGTAAYNFVERGALIVDLLDPTGHRLWRGVAFADVNRQDSPDVREKRMTEAIRRMVADLPEHRE